MALLVLSGAASWDAPAVAQDMQIPLFSACKPAAPELPPRWRAVVLMSPFGMAQLDVGELVYDSALPAMRATVYGLESGAVDLLITSSDTYLLSGPHRAPTACASLGYKFIPPTPQWLTAQSKCVGEAPLASAQAEWWKSPVSEGRADWHWFRSDTRLPWRSLLAVPTRYPAVIGDYALTYYPAFAALPETNLARLRDFCTSRARPSAEPAALSATTARGLMAIRNPPAEAERAERIAALIPGLNQNACASMKPVRWPDQFVVTAIISPIRFEHEPFPGIVHYNWSEARAQGAILFNPRARPPTPELMFVLKDGLGYDVRRLPSDKLECRPIYPGAVRPDWMSVAQCQCKGVIDRASPLSPQGPTQILACPIKHQEPRVMWNWYTAEGRPLVFAEAAAAGVGLMLADYLEWRPGQRVPPTEFELPQQCIATGLTPLPARSCSDCHTVRP